MNKAKSLLLDCSYGYKVIIKPLDTFRTVSIDFEDGSENYIDRIFIDTNQITEIIEFLSLQLRKAKRKKWSFNKQRFNIKETMKALYINTKSHLSTIEGNQNLADLIHDIALLITTKQNFGHSTFDVLDCRVSKLTGAVTDRWIENEELANKLIDLKNEIKSSLIKAKEDGIKQGKNLLLQLNRGEITLNDLL